MSRDPEQRKQLITDLVADLEPVAHPGKTGVRSLLWLGAAAFASIALMLALGPFRPGFAQQLVASPQFAIESTVGVLAILAVALAAFRSAIPSAKSIITQLALPLSLVALWAGFHVYGLHDPALPASMAGKREHCTLEVFAYGVPALILGLAALRALYPLRGVYSGALIGLAAGAIPALLMQFACMYLPPHILTNHVLPGLVVSIFGALCGFFVLRPR